MCIKKKERKKKAALCIYVQMSGAVQTEIVRIHFEWQVYMK